MVKKKVNGNLFIHVAPKSSEVLAHVYVRSRSNGNFEMLVFEERGKPQYTEKNLSEQGENQQQTQRTYDAGSEIRTQATLVGGEPSHPCAPPTPQNQRQLSFRRIISPPEYKPVDGCSGGCFYCHP